MEISGERRVFGLTPSDSELRDVDQVESQRREIGQFPPHLAPPCPGHFESCTGASAGLWSNPPHPAPGWEERGPPAFEQSQKVSAS